MAKFGVHITPEGAEMAELRKIWLLAERLGFEWISVWDHFLPMLSFDDRGSFEGIATQAALAEATTTPRIGSLVYCEAYRHPMVLAASASTIDHISEGRLELGLGAGWCAPEYAAFGVPFESPGIRLRRLKEFVEIVRLLWQGKPMDFDGEFHQLKQAMVRAPYQEKPRIWLGVQGPLAIRMAAQIADGWNCPQVSPQQFSDKRKQFLDVAPNPDALLTSVGVNLFFTDGDVKTAIENRVGDKLRFGNDWKPEGGKLKDGTIGGTVEQVRQATGEYIEAGADWIILRLMAPFQIDDLIRFAHDVMPIFMPSAQHPPRSIA